MKHRKIIRRKHSLGVIGAIVPKTVKSKESKFKNETHNLFNQKIA